MRCDFFKIIVLLTVLRKVDWWVTWLKYFRKGFGWLFNIGKVNLVDEFGRSFFEILNSFQKCKENQKKN